MKRYRDLPIPFQFPLIGRKIVGIREYQPGYRGISLIGGCRRNHLQLFFPYTIFVVTNSSLFLAFSTRPIDSRQSTVFLPTLPNCYSNFEMCLGDYVGKNPFVDRVGQPLDVSSIIDLFWQTSFSQSDSLEWPATRRLRQSLPATPTRFPLHKVYYEWRNMPKDRSLDMMERINSREGISFAKLIRTVRFGLRPFGDLR